MVACTMPCCPRGCTRTPPNARATGIVDSTRSSRDKARSRIISASTVAGLELQRRRPKRVTRAERVPPPTPTSRSERWSLDFLVDTLADVSHVEHRRRIHARVPRHRSGSLAARRARRACARASAMTIGVPRAIVRDDGPEFAGRALDTWAYGPPSRSASFVLGSRSRTRTWRASKASFAMNA